MSNGYIDIETPRGEDPIGTVQRCVILPSCHESITRFARSPRSPSFVRRWRVLLWWTCHRQQRDWPTSCAMLYRLLSGQIPHENLSGTRGGPIRPGLDEVILATNTGVPTAPMIRSISLAVGFVSRHPGEHGRNQGRVGQAGNSSGHFVAHVKRGQSPQRHYGEKAAIFHNIRECSTSRSCQRTAMVGPRCVAASDTQQRVPTHLRTCSAPRMLSGQGASLHVSHFCWITPWQVLNTRINRRSNGQCQGD
jgi:hypothetical protein